jgi:adenosylhomocysteine nucleosidase
MQTLVVMALKAESQGIFEAAGFHVFYCGVGSVKSTHNLTKWIFEHKPQRVINLGTVGSHRHPTGTLVECISFTHRQPHNAIKIPIAVLPGKATTDLPKAICGSADFVEQASAQAECDVFDMEAYALAYVCQKMNVAFTSIKYVTDSSDQNLIQDWQKNLKPAALALLKQLKEMKIET